MQEVEDRRVLYMQPAPLTSMRAAESPSWKVDNFRDDDEDDDDRPADQQIVADSFLSQNRLEGQCASIETTFCKNIFLSNKITGKCAFFKFPF